MVELQLIPPQTEPIEKKAPQPEPEEHLDDYLFPYKSTHIPDIRQYTLADVLSI